MEPETEGTLRVSLLSLKAARIDGAEEDNFQTWAHCLLTTSQRHAPAAFWYTALEELNLAKTSVTNGFEGAFGYARTSKPIHLDEASVSSVVDTTATVCVYKGSSRDAGKGPTTTDALLGWVTLPLEKIAAGERVKGTFVLTAPTAEHPLPPALVAAAAAAAAAPHHPPPAPEAAAGKAPAAAAAAAAPAAAASTASLPHAAGGGGAAAAGGTGYRCSVTLDIRPSPSLEAYCLGGRVLRLPTLALRSVPKRWRLPAAQWAGDEGAADAATPSPAAASGGAADASDVDHHVALALMCDDATQNPNRYTLALALPGSGASSSSSSPLPLPSLLPVGLGIMRYRLFQRDGTLAPEQPQPHHRPPPPPTPATPVAPAKGGKGPAAAAPPPAAAPAPVVVPFHPPEGSTWHWQVEWAPAPVFLTRGTTRALQAGIETGQGLQAVVRRALCEPTDPASDPADPAILPLAADLTSLAAAAAPHAADATPTGTPAAAPPAAAAAAAAAGAAAPPPPPAAAAAAPALLPPQVPRLPRGLRYASEDFTARGSIMIHLDALATAGAASVTSEGSVVPAPPPTAAEQEAEEAAKAAREEQWEAAVAAAAAAASGAAAGGKGGKPGAGGGKGAAPAAGKAGGPASPVPAGKGGKDGAAAGGKAGGAAGGKAGAATGKDGKPVAGGGGKAGSRPGTVTGAPATDAADALPPGPPPPHPYAADSTFLAVSVVLSAPLVPRPLTPPLAKVTAADLVRARPPPPAAPPSLDASQAFRRDIASAVLALTREYTAATAAAKEALATAAGAASGGAAAGSGGAGCRGSAGPPAAPPPPPTAAQLAAHLKASGVYERLKETLKASALAIARERFRHMPGYHDASGSRGRDTAVSYLYAYLVGQMHAAFNASIGEAQVGAALPTGMAIAPPASPSSSSAATAGAAPGAAAGSGGGGGESPDTRLRRLAAEAEAMGRYARAERLHQSRVTAAEEAAARGASGGHWDPCCWQEFACFYARRRQLARASACFREALAIDTGYLPALVCLAAVQGERGHVEDALVFADSAVTAVEDERHAAAAASGAAAAQAGRRGQRGGGSAAARGGAIAAPPVPANASPLAYALLSVFHAQRGREGDAGAALAAGVKALASLYRAAGLRTGPDGEEEEPGAAAATAAAAAVRGSRASHHHHYDDGDADDVDVAVDAAVDRAATSGGLYLIAARFLLSLCLPGLARRCIELASAALLDTDAPRHQQADLCVLRARWMMTALHAEAPVETREAADAPPVHAPPAYLQAKAAAAAAAAAGGGGGGGDASGASPRAVHPLLLTAPLPPAAAGTSDAADAAALRRAGRVAVSPAGPCAAYDRAPVSREQAEAECTRACDLLLASPASAGEAWATRAALAVSGIGAGRRTPAAASSSSSSSSSSSLPPADQDDDPRLPSPTVGASDIGDSSLRATADAVQALRMAVGCAALATVPPGSAGAAAPPVAAADPPSGSGSGGGQRVPLSSSASGIGGGLLADDEWAPTRLYLRLGHACLHMDSAAAAAAAATSAAGGDAAAPSSSSSSPEALALAATGGVPLLECARQAFLAAAAVSRSPGAGAGPAPAPAAGTAVTTASPWSVALLGAGRVAWGSGDAAGAEATLAEANVLDHQNVVTWAWLAFVCLQATPPREREASAAVDTALRLGLVGEDAECVVLLQTLAERYAELGDAGRATTLLRRAVIHAAAPAAVCQLENVASALVTLGARLADGGDEEGAVAVLRQAMHLQPEMVHGGLAPLPSSGDDDHAGGTSGAAASIAALRRHQAAARELEGDLLAKHGR